MVPGPSAEPVPAPEPKKAMPKEPKAAEPAVAPKKADAGSSATIVVSLPEDARLIVDGQETQSTSARRVFVTPNLQNGFYTMQAEVVRDGQTVVQTQNVFVRGGQTTEVNFALPVSGVASR